MQPDIILPKQIFYLVDLSENGQKRPKTHIFDAGVQPLNVFQNWCVSLSYTITHFEGVPR